MSKDDTEIKELKEILAISVAVICILLAVVKTGKANEGETKLLKTRDDISSNKGKDTDANEVLLNIRKPFD